MGCTFQKLGQSAIEYLLLLAVMVVIALMSFQTLVPGAQSETNQAFSGAAANIVGKVAIPSTAGPWPTEGL